jgi:predicted nucleic acid-binding protein
VRWRGCGGLGKRDPCCPWQARRRSTNSFACSVIPKFALEGKEIEEILALYLPFAVPVLTDPKADASEPKCRDPDDQKFLDLAHRAKADALVTGDRVLLELSGEVPFDILTPAQLRGRLEGREDE